MRILYCATDQRLPGTTGGATHVLGVARGLAALGHEVHVAAGRGAGDWPDPTVLWHAMRSPLDRPQLRLLGAPAVRRLAARVSPDVIIERYQNFGGEGVLAARALGVPAVLEINAPVIDHPGSRKQQIDRALVVQPFRRWREWQCRQAALLVTPTRDILPPGIPAERILEVEWGADVDRFKPMVSGPAAFLRSPDEVVAIFAGAFRSWHGAHLLAEALLALQQQEDTRFHGVFVGDGPELGRVRSVAAPLARVTFTGALAHDMMPATLAAADLGVAPFDVSAHAPLQLAFYWSPLKVFEYMAAGLPVVAPRIPRLAELVEDGREGVLYDPPDAHALARALRRLAEPESRAALGAAARARVVRDFSWQAHCAALDAALRRITGDRR